MAPILSDNLKNCRFCHNNKNKIKFYLCIFIMQIENIESMKNIFRAALSGAAFFIG